MNRSTAAVEIERRHAFTLVEMLVVISIIFILGSMLVAVGRRENEKQKVSQASMTVMGWLKIAQAQALRDQRPIGVRFSLANGSLVSQAQYIAQPDDWIGPLGSTIATSNNGTTITLGGSMPYNFYAGATQANAPVQPGDWIEIGSGNLATVLPITANNGASLTTTLPLPLQPLWKDITSSTDYRIVRQPRVKTGESTVSLVPVGGTPDVVIDLANSSPPAAGGNYDILFAPTGAVISTGLPAQDIKLLLYDSTKGDGSVFCVSVSIRTGLITITQIPPTGPPYDFSLTSTGHESGF